LPEGSTPPLLDIDSRMELQLTDAAAAAGSKPGKARVVAAPAGGDVLDDDEEEAAARRAKLKKRVPTAFAKGPVPEDEEEEQPKFAPKARAKGGAAPQGKAVTRATIANAASASATGDVSPPKGRGLMFRERDSILEIDNCVTGEAVRRSLKGAPKADPSSQNHVAIASDNSEKFHADETTRRKVKARHPTGFVTAAAAAAAADDAEVDTKAPGHVAIAAGGSEEYHADETTRRKVKARHPTGFVSAAAAAAAGEEEEEEGTSAVKFDVEGGKGEPKAGKKKRVPTAFVHAAPEAEEDEDADKSVRINAKEGVGEPRSGKKIRVPTAFVHSTAPPEEDDDEDEEEEKGVKFASSATADGRGEAKPGKKKRVPTAFVHNAAVPDDEEEEDETAEKVNVHFGAGVGEGRPNKIKRVPTAFVRGTADDDDEEEEEEDASHVKFDSKATADGRGEAKPGKKKRVPTAFVHAAPEDDDEEEEEGQKVQIKAPEGMGEPRENKKKRVPTAFVHGNPVEDDDDDEDAEEEVADGTNGVRFKAADGVGEPKEGKKKRVPTAFVHRAPDDDEEDDKAVKFDGSAKAATGGKTKRVPTAYPRAEIAAAAAADGGSSSSPTKRCLFRDRDSVLEIDNCVTGQAAQEATRRSIKNRVPTAAVKAAPPSEPTTRVGFPPGDEDEASPIDAAARRKIKSRQATGFVTAATAAAAGDDDEDDEEDEDGKGVKFDSAATAGGQGEAKPGKKKRVPTAFVHAAPEADEEDEDDDESGVKFAVAEGVGEAKPNAKKRVPTAFAYRNPDDDDDDDDEEEEEEEQFDCYSPQHVKIKSKEGVGEPRQGAKKRVPTAFVFKNGGQNDDEEEDEDEEEEEDSKAVKFDGTAKETTGGKPKRVPTAFPVGALDLDDDDEDGDGKSVKFKEVDSIEEVSPQGDGKRRSVQKRIPTAFVKPFAGIADEDDDDVEGRSRSSSIRTATFADAVSESDPDSGLEDNPCVGSRPSRGRIPTSFLRSLPLAESRRASRCSDTSSGDDQDDGSPTRRTDRGRLPTALGRRKSEEDLTEIMMMNESSSAGTFDPTALEINLERFRQIDAPKDAQLIEQSLRNLDIFKDIDDEAVRLIADAMTVFEIPEGTAIARQGNRNATHFFIIEAGRFEVTRDGRQVAQVERGALLGESVILLSGAQNANVTAMQDSRAYGLAGAKVRNILQQQYHEGKKDVIAAVSDLLHGTSGRCTLLSHLSQYQEHLLFDGSEAKNFSVGDVLIHRGQTESKGVYVVLKGSIKAWSVNNEESREYGRHSIAGDMLTLYHEAPAEVVCSSPVQTLLLPVPLLESMFRDNLQDELLKHRVRSCLAQYKPFDGFSLEQQEAIACIGEVIELKPGQEIEKDGVCLVLCIFGEGVEVQVLEANPELPTEYVTSMKMSGVMGHALGQDRITPGGVVPYKIRARAGEDYMQARIVVWGSILNTMLRFTMLHREPTIEGESPGQEEYSPSTRYARSPSMKIAVVQDDKVGALRKVLVFRTLTNEQLSELAASLQPQKVEAGETIFKQGDKGEEFYIIHSGLVEVKIDGRKVRTLSVGDYVGERALLFNELRSAAVIAATESELWRIGREAFDRIVTGPILDYMKERIALQNTKVEIDSLSCIKIVGRGGFGVVKMVQSKQTQTRYALKCVSIKQAVVLKQTLSLVAERSILAELDHPFVIKFIRTFKSRQYVYFLMELVTGGELLDVLQELQLLNKSQAQFYTGSIVLALEFLHERRIAYLDLKGENCLIDIHGYLKIIDFGIAERVVGGKLFEQRGTVYYMAPETLMGRGYTTVADLWSLGVCVYDFMTGQFPFGNDITDPTNPSGQNQIYDEIRKAELKFPKMLKDKAARDFIRGLLERDTTKRLGAGVAGYSELKSHRFFEGFKWDKLLARQLEPPYKPQGEVYAEDGNTASPEELVIIEDRVEDDNWEHVNVSGMSGISYKANGEYKVAGQHNEMPYLQHKRETLYIYCLDPVVGRWGLAESLSTPADKVWMHAAHKKEGKFMCPPSDGWTITASVAFGMPKVKVVMDPDPSWLDEF